MKRYTRKTYGRQCECCHCILDPGEGRYCEDCLEEMEREDRELRQKASRQKKEAVCV